MMRILKLFLFLSITFVLLACSSNKTSLLDIDKVYDQIGDSGSANLYVVYTVNSDEKEDIQVGSAASLSAGKDQGSAFYSYDVNKSVCSFISNHELKVMG